jgi:hypothetical protein
LTSVDEVAYPVGVKSPTTVPETIGPGPVVVMEHVTEPRVELGFVATIVPRICPLSVIVKLTETGWKMAVPPEENVTDSACQV